MLSMDFHEILNQRRVDCVLKVIRIPELILDIADAVCLPPLRLLGFAAVLVQYRSIFMVALCNRADHYIFAL